MSINKVIARVEQTIREAGECGKIIFLLRVGDNITIRDNSGVTGLTDEKLINKTVELFALLFPEPADGKTWAGRMSDPELLAGIMKNIDAIAKTGADIFKTPPGEWEQMEEFAAWLQSQAGGLRAMAAEAKNRPGLQP